jgi:hypothetical protein
MGLPRLDTYKRCRESPGEPGDPRKTQTRHGGGEAEGKWIYIYIYIYICIKTPIGG